MYSVYRDSFIWSGWFGRVETSRNRRDFVGWVVECRRGEQTSDGRQVALCNVTCYICHLPDLQSHLIRCLTLSSALETRLLHCRIYRFVNERLYSRGVSGTSRCFQIVFVQPGRQTPLLVSLVNLSRKHWVIYAALLNCPYYSCVPFYWCLSV